MKRVPSYRTKRRKIQNELEALDDWNNVNSLNILEMPLATYSIPKVAPGKTYIDYNDSNLNQ